MDSFYVSVSRTSSGQGWATEKLVESALNILLSGALDHLSADQGEFHFYPIPGLVFLATRG